MDRHKTCQVTLVIHRLFAVLDLMHVAMSFTRNSGGPKGCLLDTSLGTTRGSSKSASLFDSM